MSSPVHPIAASLPGSDTGKVVSARNAVRLICDGDTLATGGFVGIGFAENVTVASQFMVQLIGVVSATVWSALASYGIIMVTKMAVGLRVDPDIETQGLDLSTHGETGYNVAFGGTAK